MRDDQAYPSKHRRWINTKAEARLVADPHRPQPLRTLADFSAEEMTVLQAKADMYLRGPGRLSWVLPFVEAKAD